MLLPILAQRYCTFHTGDIPSLVSGACTSSFVAFPLGVMTSWCLLVPDRVSMSLVLVALSKTIQPTKLDDATRTLKRLENRVLPRSSAVALAPESRASVF